MKLIRQSAAFNSHRSTNSLYSNFFSTFSQASQHFQALKAILNGDSSSVLKSNDDSFDKYVKDWTRSFSPPDNKSIVVLPRNTEDISKILSYCNQHTIGVVPHGYPFLSIHLHLYLSIYSCIHLFIYNPFQFTYLPVSISVHQIRWKHWTCWRRRAEC